MTMRLIFLLIMTMHDYVIFILTTNDHK